jgi:hypothetical protein
MADQARETRIVAGCLAALLLSASAALPAETSKPALAAPRLPAAPVLDGELGEAEWAGSAVFDGRFTQLEPERGQPSPFRTIVRVGQTERALHVAFENFDPEPERVAAAATRRDQDVGDDDAVGVLLDTFADGRTAYAFATNVLGTQWDARVADNGRTEDAAWDATWACAARRLDDRWTVEFEIPFAILRYKAGADRTWGLGLVRVVPRRLETALWSWPAESAAQVSSFGTLRGLSLPARDEKRWQAIPYGLAAAAEGVKPDFQAGGDLRLRPAAAVGVDLTVNPDFALIEADVEVINLTRFELFIPEKRPFFLEGGERYQQRIRQFYSRRIGDITWGANALGTVGRTDFAGIHSSEDRGEGEERAGYAVARLQQTLPGGSTIGFLGANRRLAGEDAGSVGLDATLFFSKTLNFTGQLLRVHGPSAAGGLAWFVRPSFDSTNTHFHVRYTNLDPGIREDMNAVGFLQDDDRRELDTNFTRTFWLGKGPVERVEAGANYNRYYSHSGTLRSWELDAEAEATLRNRLELRIQRVDEYKLYEKAFRNERTELEFGWDARDGRRASAYFGFGRNYDSDLRLYGGRLAWVVGDAWRLGYSLTRLELDPDPEGETTLIHVLESSYAFTPDLVLKLFVQSNSSIDKLNLQAVGIWRFKPPFGSLQLAYQRGTSEAGQASTQGDTVFAKLAWVF